MRSSKTYAIVHPDESPIVHVRVVGEPNEVNYAEYLEALHAAFRQRDRFALIFDTGDLSKFPAKYREMQSRWLESTQPEFEGRWICSAFVIKQRLIRGALMTMYWLNQPYYEYRVTATSDDAWRWTRVQLTAAGIDVSMDDRGA